MSTYRRVQGLSRGINVLSALNRAPDGKADIAWLCLQTGLHRTTVRRLLETLIEDGYVRRSASDDCYCVCLRVRDLSEGFTDHEWISAVAAPVMGAMLKKVQWPSDLTTLDGTSMLIRESTHRFSRLSFARGMVGRRMPLLFSASGRAYIAACRRTERNALLELMRAEGGRQSECASNPVLLKNVISRVQTDQYASNEGDWIADSPTSAIALPIMHKLDVVGCLNIVFLRRAMKLEEAVRRYLPVLRDSVSSIEAALLREGLER